MRLRATLVVLIFALAPLVTYAATGAAQDAPPSDATAASTGSEQAPPLPPASASTAPPAAAAPPAASAGVPTWTPAPPPVANESAPQGKPPSEPPEPPWRPIRWGGHNALSIGLPGGDLYRNVPLNSFANELIQIGGGPDIVLFERLILGVDFSLAYVLIGDTLSQGCTRDGGSCWGVNFNVAAHAEFLILPRSSPVVPWVGVAAGFEDLLIQENVGSNNSNASFAGSDFDVSAGVDLKAGRGGAGWGPFLTYRFGQYTSVGGSTNSNEVSNDSAIANPSGHSWFLAGVRIRY